jgi:hypothetical protein
MPKLSVQHQPSPLVESAPVNPDRPDIFERPVFIVGSGRSGTSWLQRLMLANPGVCGGPESNFFSNFAGAIRSFNKGARLPRAAGLANYFTADELRDALRDLWRRGMRPMVERCPGATILLEKTPSHALWMAEIDELFPQSRFIHLIRDSRSVVASLLAAGQSEWAGEWAPQSTRAAAIQWYRHVRAAREAGRKLAPERYMELRYEDLLRDTVTQTMRCYQFIGLPLPRERVEQIADEQTFEKQKATGGTPFQRAGDLGKAPGVDKEPPGFFRKGTCDAWKSELSIARKLIIWRYTRRLMRECGYDWNGPQPFPTSTGTPPHTGASSSAPAVPPTATPTSA